LLNDAVRDSFTESLLGFPGTHARLRAPVTSLWCKVQLTPGLIA